MAGKFVIIPTSNGKFSFNLKAPNGQIILSAPGTYDTVQAAKDAVEAVRACATAAVEDQTAEGKVEGAKFELYQDESGEFRFRLKNAAGDNLAKSESYKARTSADNGIASVGLNAPDAPVEVEEPKKV